jgi:SAM-dependent methyltransferase
MTASSEFSQRDVTAWFDETYDTKGFGYLRPLAAYPIFVQLLGASAGERLLDVACGPGHLLKAAALRGVRPTGIDVSASALAIAADYVPEADVHEGNAEALPFPDATFDHVTSVGAIERFLEREKALREMLRVGKPAARYCFMVRNASTLVWRLWRQVLGRRNARGHQDALELEEWRALFERCGFAIQAVHADQWPRARWKRLLGGGPSDLTAPQAVHAPLLPLRFANEFIFVLEKARPDG